MRKKTAILVAIIALLLCATVLFAACDKGETGGGNTPGGGETPGGGNESTTQPEAKLGDYRTFSYKSNGETVYSIYAYTGNDITITLPDKDADGNVITDLYSDGDVYQPFKDRTVETIYIPASITKGISESYNPFTGAKNLKKIIVDENNPAYCSVDGAVYDKAKTRLLALPYNKTDALILPDTVTDINWHAIRCYSSLGDGSETAINSDFTDFGYFSSNISSVKFSPSLKNFTFEGCRNLQSVDFGNWRGDYLPQGTFRQCFALKTVNLPQSVKYIGTGAFQNSGLESIEISPHVRGLTYYEGQTKHPLSKDLFMGCKQLKSITAPAQLLFGERDSDDLYSSESEQSSRYGRKNNFVNCTALKTIIVNGVNPGPNGTAWAMAEYDYSSWVSDAKSYTFTALESVTYLNGCYNDAKLNTLYMDAFATDYPTVTIVK